MLLNSGFAFFLLPYSQNPNSNAQKCVRSPNNATAPTNITLLRLQQQLERLDGDLHDLGPPTLLRTLRQDLNRPSL
jgi:hypothetical protein